MAEKHHGTVWYWVTRLFEDQEEEWQVDSGPTIRPQTTQANSPKWTAIPHKTPCRKPKQHSVRSELRACPEWKDCARKSIGGIRDCRKGPLIKKDAPRYNRKNGRLNRHRSVKRFTSHVDSGVFDHGRGRGRVREPDGSELQAAKTENQESRGGPEGQSR